MATSICFSDSNTKKWQRIFLKTLRCIIFVTFSGSPLQAQNKYTPMVSFKEYSFLDEFNSVGGGTYPLLNSERDTLYEIGIKKAILYIETLPTFFEAEAIEEGIFMTRLSDRQSIFPEVTTQSFRRGIPDGLILNIGELKPIGLSGHQIKLTAKCNPSLLARRNSCRVVFSIKFI
jgi:hypothetical protein